MVSLNPPLIPFETEILVWINQHHNAFLDAFMYMISNPGAWAPLVVVLLYYLFAKKPWQEGALIVLSIGLCILICDQLSSNLAKPLFARPRPTHTEGIQDLLHVVYNYVGGPYGFFSGHSSNFFACATILALAVRQRLHSILIYSFVILVVYSRMYLGVHYLSDILVGMIVGLSVGTLVHFLREYLRKELSPLHYKPTYEVFKAEYQVWLIGLVAFLPILISYSWQVARIIKRLS